MKKLVILLGLLVAITLLAAQNYGLEFDGTYESELVIPQTGVLTPTAAITVEAWVKLNALTNLPTIVSSEDWSMGETGFVLRIENYNLTNTPQFQIGSIDSWQTVSALSGSIPTDTWTHVAGTFDGSTIKIIINGVEAGSANYTGTILPSPSDVKIGGHVDHTFNNRQWDGAIDEVRIWDTAKTAAEIAANMEMSLLGNEDNLLGYWTMNEGEGIVANDATANANHGDFYSATWVEGAPILTEAGTVEGTITIDGNFANLVDVTIGSYLTHPDESGFYSIDVAPGDYTITASIAGHYSDSAEVNVVLDETTTVDLELIAIPAPINLVYNEVTELLSWEPPVENLPIDSYNLYHNSELLANLDLATLSYQISAHGLYYVTSIYEEEESIASNSVELVYYYPPTNLQLQVIDDVNIRLIWDTPIEGGAPLTNYKIYRDGEFLEMITSNDFVYNDEHLMNGTYSYSVTALYLVTESDPTETAEIEIEYFGVPDNLTCEVVDDINAELIWYSPITTGAEVTGYNVYRDESLLAELASGQLSYSDLNLETTGYEYFVTAMYGEIESEPSNIIQIEVVVGTDENEINLEVELSNYPNPFNPSKAERRPTNTISFNIPLQANVNLTIYNSKGQKVINLVNTNLTAGNHSTTWNGNAADGSKVSSGIYFYQLSINGKPAKIDRSILIK